MPKINLVLAAHQGLALNPVTFIRLEAASALLPLEHHGAKACHVPIQLLDEHQDPVAQEAFEVFVFRREGHDLQSPAVVGDTQMTVVEKAQQAYVRSPGDSAEDKLLPSGCGHGGHGYSFRLVAVKTTRSRMKNQ
jgi:hypothetical protein